MEDVTKQGSQVSPLKLCSFELFEQTLVLLKCHETYSIHLCYKRNVRAGLGKAKWRMMFTNIICRPFVYCLNFAWPIYTWFSGYARSTRRFARISSGVRVAPSTCFSKDTARNLG